MDIACGNRIFFASTHHLRPIGRQPVSSMIRLHNRIEQLQEQAKIHGPEIECEIWISDASGMAMSAFEISDFDFHADHARGDWLMIDMKGRKHDA